MGYWREAHRWAVGNFWAWPWKALPAIVILLGRYLAFDIDWHNEVVPSLGIIVGGFIATSLVEYIWRLLFRAPVALYSTAGSQITSLQKEVDRAKERRSPADEYHYKQAAQDLSSLSKEGLDILRHIWSNERLVYGRHAGCDLTGDRVFEILNGELKGLNCLRQVTFTDPGIGQRKSWEIVPGFKPVLEDLLYPRARSAGS